MVREKILGIPNRETLPKSIFTQPDDGLNKLEPTVQPKNENIKSMALKKKSSELSAKDKKTEELIRTVSKEVKLIPISERVPKYINKTKKSKNVEDKNENLEKIEKEESTDKKVIVSQPNMRQPRKKGILKTAVDDKEQERAKLLKEGRILMSTLREARRRSESLGTRKETAQICSVTTNEPFREEVENMFITKSKIPLTVLEVNKKPQQDKTKKIRKKLKNENQIKNKTVNPKSGITEKAVKENSSVLELFITPVLERRQRRQQRKEERERRKQELELLKRVDEMLHKDPNKIEIWNKDLAETAEVEDKQILPPKQDEFKDAMDDQAVLTIRKTIDKSERKMKYLGNESQGQLNQNEEETKKLDVIPKKESTTEWNKISDKYGDDLSVNNKIRTIKEEAIEDKTTEVIQSNKSIVKESLKEISKEQINPKVLEELLEEVKTEEKVEKNRMKTEKEIPKSLPTSPEFKVRDGLKTNETKCHDLKEVKPNRKIEKKKQILPEEITQISSSSRVVVETPKEKVEKKQKGKSKISETNVTDGLLQLKRKERNQKKEKNIVKESLKAHVDSESEQSDISEIKSKKVSTNKKERCIVLKESFNYKNKTKITSNPVLSQLGKEYIQHSAEGFSWWKKEKDRKMADNASMYSGKSGNGSVKNGDNGRVTSIREDQVGAFRIRKNPVMQKSKNKGNAELKKTNRTKESREDDIHKQLFPSRVDITIANSSSLLSENSKPSLKEDNKEVEKNLKEIKSSALLEDYQFTYLKETETLKAQGITMAILERMLKHKQQIKTDIKVVGEIIAKKFGLPRLGESNKANCVDQKQVVQSDIQQQSTEVEKEGEDNKLYLKGYKYSIGLQPVHQTQEIQQGDKDIKVMITDSNIYKRHNTSVEELHDSKQSDTRLELSVYEDKLNELQQLIQELKQEKSIKQKEIEDTNGHDVLEVEERQIDSEIRMPAEDTKPSKHLSINILYSGNSVDRAESRSSVGDDKIEQTDHKYDSSTFQKARQAIEAYRKRAEDRLKMILTRNYNFIEGM